MHMSKLEQAPIHEEATIGGMLAWPGPWPEQVHSLTAEQFTSEHCAKVYTVIEEIRGDVGPVDPIDLRSKLNEYSWGYLSKEVFELIECCPGHVNLGHWAYLVTDAWRRREMERAVQDALGRGDTAEVAAAEIQRAMASVDVGNNSGLVHVSKPLGSVVRELQREYENPDSFVEAKTGIKALDKKGKLCKGQLTIIAGRPGMGKSSLAGNIASHCAMSKDKGSVALFSLEMDKSSLIRRIMSSAAGLQYEDLPSKAASGELAETCNQIYQFNLYIDDRAGISVDAIRASLSRLKQISLVVVDYLQLAKMDSKHERHDLRVGAVTKGLKAIAKDFDCHVIALSQLNRAVEQRAESKPKMSDLRDSGNIEEDADNVWLLYRAHYYNADKPENEADITIGKQRFGRTGTVRVTWNGNTQTFSD